MVIINLISQRYVLLTNSQIFDVTFLSLPDNSDEMNKFELTSAYRPTGDQPEAIAQLTEGVREGIPAQTLLGVTGSGKTFTIANVIANINKPTLILSHNKTLAAQLYSEFKGFFPNNAVEYYVSYYDYYQPEAYLPSSDTYIERPRHQRRNRQAQACRHFRPAFRTQGCGSGIFRIVHLRHGKSGRFL